MGEKGAGLPVLFNLFGPCLILRFENQKLLPSPEPLHSSLSPFLLLSFHLWAVPFRGGHGQSCAVIYPFKSAASSSSFEISSLVSLQAFCLPLPASASYQQIHKPSSGTVQTISGPVYTSFFKYLQGSVLCWYTTTVFTVTTRTEAALFLSENSPQGW